MAGGGGNEPNLTAFIDLFSVLICFLLMTAAWIQLESFQIQIEEKPKLSPDVASDVPPPPEPPEKKVKLTLTLHKDRVIAREDQLEKSFPVNGLVVRSEPLAALVSNWRQRFKADQMLILNSGHQATYGQLIRLYDLVNLLGWSEVAISPYEEAALGQ
ncbi:MAG: biopolymer transporter ExbD [Bdellovibrionaceae bacterium]|nr:biopolymer transporter ExbD [Pseudobdellovibrionaceae bacterium]MBX3033275.1 biopolymer transporter ExbD [Pseudobdellovibrionaceae bacterium]